jgi:hypothetical protein
LRPQASVGGNEQNNDEESEPHGPAHDASAD